MWLNKQVEILVTPDFKSRFMYKGQSSEIFFSSSTIFLQWKQNPYNLVFNYKLYMYVLVIIGTEGNMADQSYTVHHNYTCGSFLQ